MSKIKILALDIGHNVKFDGGAVGIRKEDINIVGCFGEVNIVLNLKQDLLY
ncbi:MAG: hypothetical protein ACRC2K_12565 [Clostridium sp.]